MTPMVSSGTSMFDVIPGVIYDLLVAINDTFQGIFIEAFVAVALYMYFSRSRKTGAGLPSTKKPKAERMGQKAPGSSDKKQVQQLIVGVMSGGKSRPEILEQYEVLVRERNVDFRKHITNDRHANSLYIAVIESAVQLACSKQTKPSAVVDRLLADMRHFGFPRSSEFYGHVMKFHVKAGFLEDCLHLYDEMVSDGVALDAVAGVCLMNVSIGQGEDDKALFFFDEIVKLGPASMRTYMTILRVHGKRSDWSGAARLLNTMKDSGSSPDNLVLNTVLGLCVSAGQLDATTPMLKEFMDKTDVISFNILLKGYSQQANLPMAEAILSQMLSGDAPAPNLITFNTVMDCAVRSLQSLTLAGGKDNQRRQGWSETVSDKVGSPFAALARRPWEILDQITAAGIMPDRYTCSTLVKGMHLTGSSSAEIERAVALLRSVGPNSLKAAGRLEEVRVGNIHSGHGGSNTRLLEVLFNTLLDACVTVKDLDRMAEVFAMMQEFRVSVSAVTFGTLIKAFGQSGKVSRCHEVWEDMRVAKIRPTIVTFGCYIDACIRNDDVWRGETILGTMEQYKVQPNTIIYTSLIRGFAHAKQPLKALEMYQRMRQEGIEPTSVTFNSVIDAITRQLSNPQKVQEVIDDMSKAHVEPDVVTYSIIIKSMCSGDVVKAVAFFRKIQQQGVTFDQVAFNTVLVACARAEQVCLAEELFTDMRQLGLVPSSITSSILVKMYGKAKMLDKAIAVSELMEREYGQKPNLYVYTCLIQACVQNQRVRQSWDILKQMLRSGVQADAVTYGTVVHGCVYLNHFDHAMALVRHSYLRPAAAAASDYVDSFGLDAVQLQQAVPLQPDVLKALLAALRRKERRALASELEAIVAEYARAH